MSLINDALKKAQRQRTGDSPTAQPPMPGGSPLPARPARSGGGLNPQILLLGAGALLGVLIATGAVFFLRNGKSETPTPATPPALAQTSAPKSAAPAATAATNASDGASDKPASEKPASGAPSPTVAIAKPAEPMATVKTDSAPAPSIVAAASTPAPIASSPSTAAKPASTEPAAPSLRMIEAIEALHVAGIRVGTGTDAKVLMNDRVYRLGDTVDHALGIKLAGVTASSLTFRDAAGATYTRNF